MENPEFNYPPRVLASSNKEIRYKGSSGGVITHIIKYLFDSNKVNSAINFRFSGIELFEPKLIFSYEEYEHTGSIYHEINIYKFLKENINNIKSPIVITCLPCQVFTIKRLLKKNNIESFIISLVCSSQLEKEATYYFLEKNNIEIGKVSDFRYRGNGWPSGIQIKTEDKEYFFHNNDSNWKYLFHSQIFTLNRCFSCKDTFGLNADFSIADPWLERYIKKDKIGSSIVVSHTEKAEQVILDAMGEGILDVIELLDQKEVILSQEYTLQKKYIILKYKKFFKKIIKLFRTKIYKENIIYFSKYHHYVLKKIIKIIQNYEGLK